jgi:type VI secretion system protein VasD
MIARHCIRATIAIIVLTLWVSGCGKKPPAPPPPPPPAAAPGLPPPPKPQPIRLSLQAAADANPDAANRPSPVVVRLYLLKSDAAFNSADFFALYDDEKAALKDDLIGRSTEFTLRPGESLTVPEFVPGGEARTLGIIAAYRDYRNTNGQWRLVAPLPLPGTTTVNIGRARVSLAGK